MLYPNVPPPFPNLAFSEESAPVRIELLSEGFVKPKKEAHFFRGKSQSTVDELKCKISEIKYSSLAVKILVGSKEKMDQCLRESGAGSSCLWTPAEGNSVGKMPSRQLNLSYRLRSEQILDVPILNGSLLELLPVSARREVPRKASYMKCSREAECPTPSIVSSNSTGEMSPSGDTVKKESVMSLVLPEKAYWQLVEMLSPGGVIREYQLLLRRLVESSNFLDLDFQLLDFAKWFRNHPFAAFLEESDLVMVRAGKGLSGLRWTLLRFDFDEGKVRSTKGEDLHNLVLIFREKAIERVSGYRGRWWGQTMTAIADKAQEKHLDEKLNKLDWKVWKIPIKKKASCLGPLTQLLFTVLGSDGMVSGEEVDSVLSLFGSQQSEDGKLELVVDIPTALSFQVRSRLSLKEECALSHLRNYRKELKSRGLRMLLTLLLGIGENKAKLLNTITKDHCLGSSHSDPVTSRYSSRAGIHASEEGMKSNFRETLRKQRIVEGEIDIDFDSQVDLKLVGNTTSGMEMGGESTLKMLRTGDFVWKSRESGILETALHRVGSRTERVLNTAERNRCRLKNGKCQSGGGLPANRIVEPIQLLDWLKSGFLEAIMEAALEGMIVESGDCLTSNGFLNVEVAAEACLRVLDAVPREGSSRLVNFLLSSLKEYRERFMKLNLKPKENGDDKYNGQQRMHLKGTKGDTLTPGKDMKVCTKTESSKLRELFEKVLKFCKLLSLLTSKSPIVGGPLGESGGFHLVFDLYFCLVKKFPLTLRLGALSSMVGEGANSDQILPGEVVKSQEIPLKVLPCILPSACICRVAQACLMDNCMSPQKESSNFACQSATDWKALCSVNSDFTRAEMLHGDQRSDNPLQKHLKLMPDLNPVSKVQEAFVLNKSQHLATAALNPELTHGGLNTSKTSLLPVSRSLQVDSSRHLCSQVEGAPSSHLPRPRRPFVPQLLLNSLKSEVSEVLSIPATRPDLNHLPSARGATPLNFEIFSTVCNVKLELLQTMSSLFSNHSHSLSSLRRNFLQKIQEEEEDQLVLRFLPDIIGGFLNIVPESTSRRIKRRLFQLISLIDRSCKPDDLTLTQSLCKSNNHLGRPCPTGNVSDSPFSLEPKTFLDILLLEIGERLGILVRHLTQMLAKSKYEDQEFSNTNRVGFTPGVLETSCPLFQDQTISSGYLLSLWVDVGLLLRVLVDFVLQWPEQGSVQSVLKSCGRQVESVIGLLAEHSSKSNWSLAHILTMQYLLKLFTVCMKKLFVEKSPEFQVWTETHAYFWQLLVMNDVYWDCVKSFTSWVILESCEGCLRNLVDGYEKVLWEPLEIYYSMLGEHVYNSSSVRNFSSTVPGVEISTTNIFPFLRVIILMLKKRLESQNTPQCVNLYMGRLIFLLDFLMNPKEGLLMSVIRSPVPCMNLWNMEGETKALNVLNLRNISKSFNKNHIGANPEPTFQANPESLYANHVCGQSRKFATTCTQSSVQRFTSCMKQESLCILADIFSLKAPEHPNLCINPHVQNPFLFANYVNPFLKIVFFYFLKSYNKKVNHSEPGLISSSSIKIATHCELTGNAGQLVSECQKEDGSFLVPDIHLTINNSDTLFCSIHNEDDVSSASCLNYGQVLLALAKNQTGDVSQSFQQMRIMNFLVHQLSLEYEASQLATPRDIELVIGLTKTPFTLKEGGNAGDSDPLIPQPGTSQIGGQEKVDNLEDQVEELEQTVHNDMKLSDELTEPTSPNNTVETRMLALQADELSPGKPRHSEDSKACSEHQKLSSNEHSLKSSLQSFCCHVGFNSACETKLDSNATNRCSSGVQDIPFVSSKRMRPGEAQPKFTVPFWQPDDIIFDKQSMTRCRTHCISYQSKQGGGALSNRSSRKTNEDDFELPVSRVQSPISQDNFVDNTKPNRPSEFEPSKGVNERKCEMSTLSTSPSLRYTGRFFDLNEEVDRELAEEEFQEYQTCILEKANIPWGNKFSRQNVEREDDLQKYFTNLTPLDYMNSKQCTSHQSSDSDSSSELGPKTVPKQKCTHPAIPRLNLSKSVRKGGPAIISDTSKDVEVVPFITSTIESKDRLSSLQKEFQKEVVDSDSDSKRWGTGTSYETKCLQRRLYRHAGLHVLLLELFVSLMLTPQGSLDPFYSDRYPMENCKLNAPFFLSYHLNHVANGHVLHCLSKRIKDFKPAAFRILKLTWRALFDPKIYSNRVRIARGALSQVYTAKKKRQGRESEAVTEERVVLKIVDVPKGPHDPCKFFDVYSEVEILEKFVGDPAVCQILDYGVDTESFILVLKHYKCSLHTWRQGHYGNPSSKACPGVGVVEKFVLDRLPLYLEVYSAVLHAVKALGIENVVHYDLKCDNILLEPVDPVCSETEFWTPIWPPVDPSKPLPFCICIADFGQSKASMYLGGECTVRNRGTEYVKSPEMLKLLSSRSQRDSDFNLKSRDEGVGKAVDVWSLGCLLYELLTGEYLFYDEDWLQFFMRVTLPSEELITKEKAAKLENYGPVVDLLRFILIRDPLQRPSIDEVAICVEQLQLKLQEKAQARKTNADEFTSLIEVLSEEDSDELSLENPVFSTQRERVFSVPVEIGPARLERKKSFLHTLKCFTQFLCHCKCGDE